jgi:hypothetical protein
LVSPNLYDTSYQVAGVGASIANIGSFIVLMQTPLRSFSVDIITKACFDEIAPFRCVRRIFEQPADLGFERA